MVLNNVIDRLREWCINKADIHHKIYAECGGVSYIGYQIAYELEFKLSTLTDRNFESIEEFKRAILNFVDVHYEPYLVKPQNRLAEQIIDKTNREFCDYLEELLSENESVITADIPYKRVIVGAEATELKTMFSSVWRYTNTSYWYPLMGDEPTDITDKMFIMFDRFEQYMKQICQIIGLPQTHILRYGETLFRPEHCIETTELIEYGGCETIYTDKDYSWAIYFSHEFTVSFAGVIVPKVQELLVKEKPYWNKFEWNSSKE